VTDTEPLLLTRDGAVATLTINRPQRLNALTYAMFAQLPKLLEEAAALPGIRALVLRGAGTRAFSAGADISEFETARMTRERAAAYDDAVLAAEEALASFPTPTLAAVHGHCYGGGCGLAVACDIRRPARDSRSPRRSSAWCTRCAAPSISSTSSDRLAPRSS
jgi:enoyl-CoA hydratase/carnithine racemase